MEDRESKFGRRKRGLAVEQRAKYRTDFFFFGSVSTLASAGGHLGSFLKMLPPRHSASQLNRSLWGAEAQAWYVEKLSPMGFLWASEAEAPLILFGRSIINLIRNRQPRADWGGGSGVDRGGSLAWHD